MNIEWTNYSDKFPPDENVIAMYQSGDLKILDISGFTETLARLSPDIRRDTVWTPFTQEKWEALNK